MSAAVEREWLHGLSEDWQFVSSDAARRYLERLRRMAVAVAPQLPSRGRVLLVREPSLRSLSLPAGSVCLSTGLMDSVLDEAELLFVLAHELAHSASNAWPRHALRGLASSGDASERRRRWLSCAEDLIRLGHGDRQEFAADRLALEVARVLGYDSGAPLRWLRRIERRMFAGDRDLAEFALAHPSPNARANRIESERNLQLTSDGPAAVCNRAIFRRVLGHSAIRTELQPVAASEVHAGAASRPSVWRRRAKVGLLTVGALAAAWWLWSRVWVELG